MGRDFLLIDSLSFLATDLVRLLSPDVDMGEPSPSFTVTFTGRGTVDTFGVRVVCTKRRSSNSVAFRVGGLGRKGRAGFETKGGECR